MRATPGRIGLEAAFTLLEMLVALAILGLVTSALYGTFSRTLDAQQYARLRSRRLDNGRAALRWLARDLRASFDTRLYPSELKLFFSSGRASYPARDGDPPLLELTGLSARGLTQTDSAWPSPLQVTDRGDQTRVVYRLEAEDVSENDRGLALVRYEFRPPAPLPLRRAIRQVVATGVDEIDLRFFDGREWHEQWDSSQTGPRASATPRLVTSTVVLVGDREQPSVRFSSTVALALARGSN
ncbi:MAG: type II secretion system protein GspJ [Candidatus Binatia bacterium]